MTSRRSFSLNTIGAGCSRAGLGRVFGRRVAGWVVKAGLPIGIGLSACNVSDETESRREFSESSHEPYSGGPTGSRNAPETSRSADPSEASAKRSVLVPANPFVLTRQDPLSTFAADVDTGSYDLFRRDVRNGYLLRATVTSAEIRGDLTAGTHSTEIAGASRSEAGSTP